MPLNRETLNRTILFFYKNGPGIKRWYAIKQKNLK